MVPCLSLSVATGECSAAAGPTLGATADSFYEYLLKQHILTNEPGYREMWLQTFETAEASLAVKVDGMHLVRIGVASDHMDHLSCFWGGAVALATMHGVLDRERGTRRAEELTSGCYEAFYARSPTGLSPDSVHWSHCPDDEGTANRARGLNPGAERGANEPFVCAAEANNRLRPETVESLFYTYRLTKKEIYREWGRRILDAFLRHSEMEPGSGRFANVRDVRQATNVQHVNQRDTFWTGETLKYLYLLLSDRADLMPLDEWVFNTEAHPLRIRRPRR